MKFSIEKMNPPSVSDKPITVKIKEIIKETPKIKTFIFNYAPLNGIVNILPGQFVMVWIPGVDEIPMSVSYLGRSTEVGITVQDVGEATHKLHQLKIGDYIGIRGPYGSYFEWNQKYSVIIAGGVGLAALREFIMGIHRHNPEKLLVINGAKKEEDLLYKEEFEKKLNNIKLTYCTDDGSCGFNGFTSDYLKENIEKLVNKYNNKNITVYTCGPEIMMKKVFEICESYNIEVQASLERMMRCGFGLCGLCVLEPLGIKVCKDGPVFNSDILRRTNDFGKYYRGFSGERINY